MKKEHLFTKDQKVQYWGTGEWIDEPDEVEFDHLGIHCVVKRIYHHEIADHMFGGHLCGYCELPEGHKFYEKEDFNDWPYDVHGGITFVEDHVIGFDCAHFGDLVPSIGLLTRDYLLEDSLLKKYNELRPSGLNKFLLSDQTYKNSDETYKNMDFVIKECRNLAEQIAEDMEKK